MPLSLRWDEGDLDLKKVRDTLQGEWAEFRQRIERGEAVLWDAYGREAKVPNAVLRNALRDIDNYEALQKRGRLPGPIQGSVGVIYWRQTIPRQ